MVALVLVCFLLAESWGLGVCGSVGLWLGTTTDRHSLTHSRGREGGTEGMLESGEEGRPVIK
ncbi:hypothetical protein E2C01_092746 [Portunus trituberculatus]|uniref:Uncharacterized protein n=1 Tax=Portunus trituberculatus TaxID=210409 RepID=A0A5B7JH85_PORTR|nr:hypothetical protein [Portunus trituberculatus]